MPEKTPQAPGAMLRKVLFNSGMLFAGQLVVKILGLVWIAIIARHLGDAGFGYLSYALSLAGLFGVLVEFGFSYVLTRAVARSPGETAACVSNILGMRLALTCVSVPLTLAASLYTGATSSTLLPVLIAALATAVAGIGATSTSVFFGRERMEYPSVIMVGSKVASILIGLLVVRMGGGIVWIALLFLLEPLMNLVISIPILSREFGVRFVPVFRRSSGMPLFREALPFVLTMALGMIYFRIDVVMLSAMQGAQAVGWYSAGYRLLEGLVYLPGAFINTLFPVMARLKSSSDAKLAPAVSRAWEFMAALALPAALTLIILSEGIVAVLFGDQFMETVPVLRLIGAALFFVFVNNLLGTMLGAIDRQMAHFYASLAGVVVNVLLNLWWIPKYAHVGAAGATLLTQGLVFALLSFLVFRYLGARPGGLRLLKLAACGILMSVVLLATRSLPLGVALASGSGAYIAALFLVNALTPEEKRLVRSAIGMRRER